MFWIWATFTQVYYMNLNRTAYVNLHTTLINLQKMAIFKIQSLGKYGNFSFLHIYKKSLLLIGVLLVRSFRRIVRRLVCTDSVPNWWPKCVVSHLFPCTNCKFNRGKSYVKKTVLFTWFKSCSINLAIPAPRHSNKDNKDLE